MIRFTLSRFWPQAALAAGLLAVIAAFLGVTGPHLAHLWDTSLGPCLAAHPAIAQLGPGAGRNQCKPAFVTLAAGYAPYQWLRDVLGIAVLVVPGLAGLFWGAPLIAPELHDGTWRLAWTQSVTRTRWLAVRLAVAGVASVAAAGLLSFLVTWWAGPLDQLASLGVDANSGRFNLLLFSERGLAPAGYAALGFMLGATAGVVFRRTVPALAAALAGLAGARLAVTYWVRQHLVAPAHLALPITRSTPIGWGQIPFQGRPPPLLPPPQALALAAHIQGRPPGPGLAVFAAQLPDIQNAWVFSDQIADRAGHAPTPQFLLHSPCKALLSSPMSGQLHNACADSLATRFHQLVTLQPASRYWLFQAYETAVFTAAALVLAAACLWWIRRLT